MLCVLNHSQHKLSIYAYHAIQNLHEMLPKEKKTRLISQSCWESYVRYVSIIEPGGHSMEQSSQIYPVCKAHEHLGPSNYKERSTTNEGNILIIMESNRPIFINRVNEFLHETCRMVRLTEKLVFRMPNIPFSKAMALHAQNYGLMPLHHSCLSLSKTTKINHQLMKLGMLLNVH